MKVLDESGVKKIVKDYKTADANIKNNISNFKTSITKKGDPLCNMIFGSTHDSQQYYVSEYTDKNIPYILLMVSNPRLDLYGYIYMLQSMSDNSKIIKSDFVSMTAEGTAYVAENKPFSIIREKINGVDRNHIAIGPMPWYTNVKRINISHDVELNQTSCIYNITDINRLLQYTGTSLVQNITDIKGVI